MTPVVLLPAALEELAAAAYWYEQRQHGLGVDLVSRVQDVLDRVAESPASFAAWPEDSSFRKVKVSRFPYIVFYQSRDDAVYVVAIAHGRRPPGYWKTRAE